MKLSPPVHWVTWRMHHAYLGILMVLYGLTGINDCTTSMIGWAFIVIGGYTMVDDIVEHTITGSTPLRILYEWLIR